MIHKLKNTPVRELIRALEQDGFQINHLNFMFIRQA